MIEKTPNCEINIFCDRCSFMETIEETIWQGIIDYMKSHGWKITKEDGEWVHICPACLDDE